jgi:hypothetical protein
MQGGSVNDPTDVVTFDLEWVQRQMHREADNLHGRRCFYCEVEGPGLYWLPSEEGIIEMPIWCCGTCIAVEHVTHSGRSR